MTKFNLCNLSKSQVASSKNTKEIFSGLRRFYLGRENRAVSDLVRVVAPSPPCSGKSRRLRLGRESSKKCFFLVAPSQLWSRKSSHFLLDRESRKNFFLVAPSQLWSRKSSHFLLNCENRKKYIFLVAPS